MKKNALLWAGLITFGLAVHAGGLSAQTVTLRIPDLSVGASDREVGVPVEMENPDAPVRAVQIVLVYDAKGLKAKATRDASGQEIPDVQKTERTVNLSVFASVFPASGELRIILIDLGPNQIAAGKGPIVTIPFELVGGAPSASPLLIRFVTEGPSVTKALAEDRSAFPLVTDDGLITLAPAPPGATGDFNDDDRVDYADFFLFVEAFGAAPGSPKWDARFDLDRDGRVGLSDFFLFAEHFGR